MANVYPTSSGNYSTRTWNNCATGLAYGQAPLATDTIYLNNTTLTINQDVTVVAIDNAANGSAVAGGLLALSGDRTITANILHSKTNNATYLTIYSIVTIIGNISATMPSVDNTYNSILVANTGTLTVTGNITGAIGTGNNPGAQATIRNDGVLSVIGNLTGGTDTGTNGGSHYAVYHAGISLSINGQIIGGSKTTGSLNSSYGLAIGSSVNPVNITSPTAQINAGGTAIASVYNAATQTVNINQSINGNSTFKSKAYLIHASTGQVNINGDVLALTDKYSTTLGIIDITSSGKIVISGKVVGGTIANSIAISNSSTGEVQINGDCESGTQTGSYAYYSTTASKLTVLGNTVSKGTQAIYSTSQTATNIIKGNIVNSSNIVAFFGYNLKCDTGLPQVISMYDGTINEQYATSNAEPSQPIQRDVELGTVYGSTSQYTGTMVLPATYSVFKAVPVGQSLGTLEISADGVWNVDIGLLSTNNSIGKLLKHVATQDDVASSLVALG